MSWLFTDIKRWNHSSKKKKICFYKTLSWSIILFVWFFFIILNILMIIIILRIKCPKKITKHRLSNPPDLVSEKMTKMTNNLLFTIIIIKANQVVLTIFNLMSSKPFRTHLWTERSINSLMRLKTTAEDITRYYIAHSSDFLNIGKIRNINFRNTIIYNTFNIHIGCITCLLFSS